MLLLTSFIQSLDLLLNLLNDHLIWWLFLKSKRQHLLDHRPQTLRYHIKQRLGVFQLLALLKEIFEFIVEVLKHSREITPRQGPVIEEVDHDVDGRLDVVPTRLIVAPTTVQRGE